jgi:hypothetical protein
MFSRNLKKHFKVSVADLPSFTQNFMQTHCSILPSIAGKSKHEVRREVVKNNVCSQRRVMWQTDAIGLPPFSSFFIKTVTTVTVQEHFDTPRTMQHLTVFSMPMKIIWTIKVGSLYYISC